MPWGVARPAGRSCARSSSVHCTERRTTANSAPSPDGTRPSHSVVTMTTHRTTPNNANYAEDGRRLTPGRETGAKRLLVARAGRAEWRAWTTPEIECHDRRIVDSYLRVQAYKSRPSSGDFLTNVSHLTQPFPTCSHLVIASYSRYGQGQSLAVFLPVRPSKRAIP